MRPHAPGGKDVVGEAKGVYLMDMRIAGRGPRNRGDRREEIEGNPKTRSLGHNVSNF